MPSKAIIVSHTHWDREWYLTFQEYRLRLVRVVDKAIDLLLNNPKFRHFMLDGQTSIVEDYLEVKPHMEEVIRRLVSDGRLLIGPLYTQPDEALASGEALVRNFLLGHRIAQRYGGAMNVGYLPDTFGHIPQLPQILRGFDLDSLFFMRGLGDEEERLGTEFLWEAPDGSRVLAVNMRMGYCNANMLGVGVAYEPHIWRSPEGWYTVFLEVYYREPEPDLRKAYERVKELADFLLPRTPSRNLLLMNGCDHQPPQARITELIDYLNASDFDLSFEHGTLREYADLAMQHIDEMEVFRGELRGARSKPLLVGVLSARIYLKQLNYRSQLLLEKYAEPLSTIAFLHGSEYPHRTLMIAWKLVLQNHAHDSIYGSGTDPLHLENESRFLQAIEIASNVAYDAARRIAGSPESGGDGPSVLVFNPSNWSRTDSVSVVLPADLKDYNLVAVGEEGETPVQVIEPERYWHEVPLATFVARDVPPLGFKVYKIETRDQRPAAESGADYVIENEFFRVESLPERGGALRILDKESGRWYEDFNVFVDEGDAGDEYNYSPPKKEDRKVVSTSFRANVEKIEGPSTSMLKIRLGMEVPARLDGQRRSGETVTLPITTEVSLYPGVRRIDVKTTIDNLAEDHRFRAKFPTGLRVDRSYADSQFYVVERSIEPQTGGEGWVEEPPRTHPQLYWVGVGDGGRGVIIANRGLPEYEVRDENGATVYLTLFRSVGWLSRGDLLTRRGHAGPAIPTPGAQCKRRMTFEYSIIPHRGDWLSSKAYKLARSFAEPLLALPLKGIKGLSGSVVKVEPDTLIVTALKKAEDNDWVVLRFYNISGRAVRGRVEFSFDVSEVWEGNLNEKALRKLDIHDNKVEVDVGPHKIVTLLVKPPG